MLLHRLPFALVEGTRLEEYLVRHADLPDIVEQRPPLNVHQPLLWDAHLLGKGDGEARHPL